MVDIETLSCHHTAAIISIAAVLFNKNAEREDEIFFPDDGDGLSQFEKRINATSCALYGFDFDQNTIEFWSKQSEEAKKDLLNGEVCNIDASLASFISFLEGVMAKYDAEIILWSKGSSFDFPILGNAILKTLGEKQLPWKYFNIRDARTYILEGLHIILEEKFHEMNNPYQIFKSGRSDWVLHSAIGDAKRTAFLVNRTRNLLCSKHS